MKKKSIVIDSLVIGFALFAMFFGAGNLIFPPYLGFGSASNWFWGFIAFIITDIGLSIFALLMIAKKGGRAEGITNVIGKKWSTLLLVVNTICLGPLIAIPRTGATTFEFAVQPIFPEYINSWASGIIFFGLVILLSLKQSKIVDIIGTILTPIMLVALGLLIIKGVTSPLGAPGFNNDMGDVIKEGIKSGYQTMDMLGATILSVALMVSINGKGYKTTKDQSKMIILAGIVAAVGLFSVYCGLAYLGASVSTVYPTTYSQAELLIAITKGLMGQSGVVLLGIIVACACLTTAIGLSSSAARYFYNVSGGKLRYIPLIILINAFSCVVSNFGISKIISLAAPILDIIYPILLVLTFMALFSEHIKNNNIYKGAVVGALIVSVLTLVEKFTGFGLFVNYLPLANMGFAWVVPAIVGGIAGYFIKPKSGSPTAIN